MNLTLIKEALNCFTPALAPQAREQAIEQLQEIIDDYRRWGKKRIVFVPLRRQGETDVDHEARCQARLVEPRKRGRPALIAQHLLLLKLRDVLGQHGCNYGVYKDGDSSPLVQLASIVDLAAGKPKGDVDWQALANRYVDPLYEFKLMLGDGFQYPQGKTKACREALRLALRKAYKRISE